MSKISSKTLKWRRKQKAGAIMKPSTFQAIKARAAKKYGAKRATKIAGAAYWQAVKTKAKARHKK
jgi:hypothetical protein